MGRNEKLEQMIEKIIVLEKFCTDNRNVHVEIKQTTREIGERVRGVKKRRENEERVQDK